MASSRFVFIVLLVSAVFLPLCASSLEKGSIYNLRNVADESYLRVESGGALCKYMGPVVTHPLSILLQLLSVGVTLN
ncbi:hypothetical protein Ocin01_07585 [Orchesella cincta]|uniref:Uncharacterized protein n=1 Tax=Orchesella cincta TaxID=48709 RepID=A0A1D2N1C7_ORCCI|nr:hypothetical protein Ocin01_07585 [Orchesella cincta]